MAKRIIIKLRHQAKDSTNRRSFLNFCEILQNSAEKGKFCGSARNPATHRKLYQTRKVQAYTLQANPLVFHSLILQVLFAEYSVANLCDFQCW